MKFDKRTTENMHKLVVLIREYEGKDITELSQLFQTSPIEFNAAAWGAVDSGFIKIHDDNKVELLKQPEKFELGELVEHLMEIIPYTVGKINENEADIEDNYFSSWTAGFPAHDVMIAVKKLIADGKLASYEIVDVEVTKLNREERRKRKDGKTELTSESTYTFYTMPKNVNERWGEKQFKDAKMLQEKQAQAK